jgi:hypothetical protein
MKHQRVERVEHVALPACRRDRREGDRRHGRGAGRDGAEEPRRADPAAIGDDGREVVDRRVGAHAMVRERVRDGRAGPGAEGRERGSGVAGEVGIQRRGKATHRGGHPADLGGLVRAIVDSGRFVPATAGGRAAMADLAGRIGER